MPQLIENTRSRPFLIATLSGSPELALLGAGNRAFMKSLYNAYDSLTP
jgi:hypothetical protein